MKNNKILFNITLISILISILTLGYLTKLHFDLASGTHVGKSLCNIGSAMNCETVNSSAYAKFLNIPISLWGLMTQLVLLITLLIGKTTPSQSNSPHQRTFIFISYVALIVSVVMAGISTFVLKQFCLFCILIYISNITTAIAGSLLFQVKLQSWSNYISDLTNKFASVLLVLLIPGGSWLANAIFYDIYNMKELSQLKSVVESKIELWKKSPSFNFDPSSGLILNKQENSPFIIVEFADFRCPHCKHAAPVLHKFAQDNPNVQLIFKPYPLDPTCNSAMGSGGGTGVSCQLAYLTYCAEKLNSSGWKTHDAIFERQEQFLRSQSAEVLISEIIREVQIDPNKAKECMQSEETYKAIQDMTKEGQAAQIKGTPTVFVNGKLLEGGQVYQILKAAYDTISQ